MKVLLAAHGSRGDVYPMIALARRFKSEGHEVTMLTQQTFIEALRSYGINGLYTSEDARKEMGNLDDDGSSVGNSLKWAQKSLEEEFALLGEASKDADVLICTNNEFSVSSLAEARGIPAFRVAYIPSIPGKNVPPLIPWQNLPEFLCKPMWNLINKGLDFMALKTANRERAALGLAPIKSLSKHFMATFTNLFAFNEKLAPPHPSWPEGSYHYCGYAFEDQMQELPRELEEFLEAGDPPIYLGFGSVSVKNPGEFTDMALEAAEKAGCRLVMSRGWTGLGREDMPEHAILIDDVSHDRLFPRTAAVCHHGGSGTIHRAARAGVPQFIMPIIIDQFFWGKRIHSLGVGPEARSSKKMKLETLTEIFRDLKTNSIYRENAGKLKEAVDRDGGVDAVYEAIVGEMAKKAEPAA
jgi:UDP:flavonoid glycosyltransferase YjiC (YdhE family)